MGVVYRAEDERLRRRVALKLLSAQLAADERFCERFVRESRLAAAIEHPGVVPVYEAGDIDGVLYLAMRYVDGRDLGAILRSDGALAPERAVALVEQLADALDVAHAAGLIHRDVKPANTLVSSERGDERVYLVDFGITQDITNPERLTETGQLVGSVDYVAPERIRGDPIDGRADVYSLGCVLYQCLTGEVPFPRDSDMTRIYAHLQDEPPSASERRPGVPPALDAVVLRALAKEPEERWQSCGELAEAARSALAGTAPVAPARRRRPRAGARAAHCSLPGWRSRWLRSRSGSSRSPAATSVPRGLPPVGRWWPSTRRRAALRAGWRPGARRRRSALTAPDGFG